MGALDPTQVLPLQHRAAPSRHVLKRRHEQPAAGYPGPGGQRLGQTRCRRTPGAGGVRQRGDQPQLVGSGQGDVEDRLLESDARRSQVPEHVVTGTGSPADDDPGRRHQPAVPLHLHVDPAGVAAAAPRPLERAPRRLPRQRGRPCPEHRGPRQLLPGRRTCVVDVDAAVHLDQLATAQHPVHGRGVGSRQSEQLPAGHHPVLVPQHPRQLVHLPTLARPGHGSGPVVAQVWTTVRER